MLKLPFMTPSNVLLISLQWLHIEKHYWESEWPSSLKRSPLRIAAISPLSAWVRLSGSANVGM